jgi:hypothetical protein
VITVQTADINSSGTDANVFITLNGEKNKITRHPLEKSEGNKNPFEKGKKDQFKFNGIDIGQVSFV